MRRHLLVPIGLILVVVAAAGLSLFLKPHSTQAEAPYQTIAFDPLADKTFGDADFVVSATADSGLVVRFNSDTQPVCTVTLLGGTVHIVAAGVCTIRAWQDGDIDWDPAPDLSQSFTVNKANQTITFAALPDRTVGDADFTVSATATSGLTVTWGASGDCTNPSGTTIHLTAVAPGSCTVTASQTGDSNWNAATAVDRTFSILAATATPTATSTQTPTVTNTPTPTVTNTPAPTSTNTAAPTSTNTPAPTSTNTAVPAGTDTPAPTSTNTPAPTATNTPAPTSTATPIPTSVGTATVTVPVDGGDGVPGGATLYGVVTTGGTASITRSSTSVHTLPGGFSLVGQVMDVTTTATFTFPITICFGYDPALVTVETSLVLYHDDGTGFVDVTTSIDTVNNIICGSVDSLSPFAVMQPSPRSSGSVATATTVPASTAVPADTATAVAGTTGPQGEPPRAEISGPNTGSGGDAARGSGGDTSWWPIIAGTALAVMAGAAMALKVRRG